MPGCTDCFLLLACSICSFVVSLSYLHSPLVYMFSEKVSDACHGPSAFRQTRNILTCNNETQICITDVRYYQWDPLDQDCPYLISQPVAVRCCCRIPSRCSVVTDDRQELQRNCTGQTSCSLHSAMSEKVSPPCNSSQSGSEVSSVRSITYICSSAGKSFHLFILFFDRTNQRPS